ncbi:MAG: hypothetical protein ACXADW_19035 [Candidatus Hodarchaeales archaeon]|jgi:hypothetical protein
MPTTVDGTLICVTNERKFFILRSIEELTFSVIQKKIDNGIRQPKFKDEKSLISKAFK